MATNGHPPVVEGGNPDATVDDGTSHRGTDTDEKPLVLVMDKIGSMGSVPKFTGEPSDPRQLTLEQYFHIIELQAPAQNWTRQQMCCVAKLRLEGNALQLLLASSRLREITCYDTLKSELRQYFTRKRTEPNDTVFRRLRQKEMEPVRAFAARLRAESVNLIYVGVNTEEDEAILINVERTLLQQFKRGLLRHLSSPVWAGQPQTLNEAVTIAEIQEEAALARRDYSATDGGNTSDGEGEPQLSRNNKKIIRRIRQAREESEESCNSSEDEEELINSTDHGHRSKGWHVVDREIVKRGRERIKSDDRQRDAPRSGSGRGSTSRSGQRKVRVNTRGQVMGSAYTRRVIDEVGVHAIPNLDQEVPKGNGRNYECFVCGSPNHMRNQCPQTLQERMKNVDCYVCGRLGHWARECPNRASFPRRPFQMVRFADRDERVPEQTPRPYFNQGPGQYREQQNRDNEPLEAEGNLRGGYAQLPARYYDGGRNRDSERGYNLNCRNLREGPRERFHPGDFGFRQEYCGWDERSGGRFYELEDQNMWESPHQDTSYVKGGETGEKTLVTPLPNQNSPLITPPVRM